MSSLRWISFLALFTLLGLVKGQSDSCSFTLSGAVRDEHDLTPLAYAEVFIPALGKGAVADVEGRFSINGLCQGRYRIRVMHLGCEPVEQSIDLDQDMYIQFKLEHHAHELREFEVARARPDEQVGLSSDAIDRAAMERGAGRTMAEMLTAIPGVNVLLSGPTIGKPVIHGLSGNRILILNQGIRQEDQQWGTEHAPGLDPFSGDKLTVVKGAASVQYGSDALGGVVITGPVELPREGGISGEVGGVGMTNGKGGGGDALLQGGFGGLRGLGWRLQGSGRLLGDSHAPDYVLSNTGMNEAGASASIGYRDHRWNASAYYSYFQRELGILRASHIGNLTDLENAIASGEPWYVKDFTYAIEAPRQEAVHHLVKADAAYAISERDRIQLTYGYQADDRQEYDIRRGGRTGIPSIDLQLITHTGDAVLKHWLGNRVHGKVGLSGMYQENINVPGTGVRPLIPNYLKQSGGVFLLEHLPISERLEMEAGIRMEATRLEVARYTIDDVLVRPEHDFTNGALTLGASWNVKDSVRLRFNVGTAFRPPHVSELYSEGLHHGAAAIELGDPELTSERSLKATVDLEAHWFDGRLRTDITVYTDRINDYIYLRPDGYQLTIRGAFPVFQYVATDALLYGSDAFVQYELTPTIGLRSRASLVRGKDLLRKEWLFLMPADRIENAVLFHKAEAGKWREMEISVTSQMVFEQIRVPVDLDFTGPPEAYHLIGLQVSATRPMVGNELRIGLRGSNLFNTAYRDYMDRFRYYADARGTDISIWVRYSFGT